MIGNITQPITSSIVSPPVGGGPLPAPAYDPPMMTFAGAGRYYDSMSGGFAAGAQATTVFSFIRDPFTGDTLEYLAVAFAPGGFKMAVEIFSDDYSAAPELQGKLRVDCYDGGQSWVSLAVALSKTTVTDGKRHTGFASYNASTGTWIFYMDSADADDLTYPGRKALTGTLSSGAGYFNVGNQRFDQFTNTFNGQIGYIGYKDTVALTNPLDFMDGRYPKKLDEVTWPEWGGVQPDYFRADGNMILSQGSQGIMTKAGTITGPT